MNAITTETDAGRAPVNALLRAAEFLRRHSVLFALLVPFVVCSPLLSHKGLFEFGDANFPLRPFPLDFVLPWQSLSDGGVDNVFIGLPRVAYYGGINFVEMISFSLQLAQWLWYSALLAFGVWGGWLLTRRLGAGAYAIPLGLFWALNLWSYDRVSQGPLFLAYQTLPLALFLFLRYLDTGKLYFAVAFAASTFLLTPSLQAAYIAAVCCAMIAVYCLVSRPARLQTASRLVACAAAVALFNAYFLTTLLGDIRLNAHNSLHLVSANFSKQTFLDYSSRATLGNALQLGAFFYSTLDQEPYAVRTGAWLPLFALLGVIALPALWRQARFWAAACLFLLGVWLVSGVTLTQPALLHTRGVIPGLKSFVEPDYLTPLIVLGYISVISLGANLARRVYGTVWPVLIFLMICPGIVAFLPGLRPLGGLPQTPIPKTYVEYAHERTAPRVLWVPPIWVAEYEWSPYTLNGFNVLNSPADYVGPYMLEWVSPASRAMIDSLFNEMQAGHTSAFLGLAQALGVQNIAVSADQRDPSGEINPMVHQMGAMMHIMAHRHYATPREIRRDGGSKLITQHVRQTLPLVGLYQRATVFGGEYQALGDAVDALAAAHEYRPIIFDGSPTAAHQSRLTAGPAIERPNVVPLAVKRTASNSRIPAAHADSTVNIMPAIHAVRDCSNGGSFVRSVHDSQAFVLSDRRGRTLCASLTLPVDPRFQRDVKLRFRFSGTKKMQPTVQFVFIGKHHGAEFVDAAAPQRVAVPQWARAMQIILYGSPHGTATYASVRLLRWGYHGFVLSEPQPAKCSATFQREDAGMAYHIIADVKGACSIVLRESFSSLWTARITRGTGLIGRHQIVDGYANGWAVSGNGAMTLEVYNELLAPFRAGALISIISIICAIAISFIPLFRRKLF